MENYKNARDLLKKQLYDKLMIEQFSWELNIGPHNFVIDSAITKEEHIHRLKMIEHVVNHLIFEFDTYLFEIACNPEYKNIPTIFCLMNANVDFDDTPIKEEDIYEVAESTLQRTPDYSQEKRDLDCDLEAQRSAWKQLGEPNAQTN